jgi:hypothetical protein
MYVGGGFTLQGEWDRYIGQYGGTVGYGGAQAGTGIGGVGGVGPVAFHSDGSVSTGSTTNAPATYTMPDGTKVTTTVTNGLRTQVTEKPDGTKITAQEFPPSTDDQGRLLAGGARELIEQPDGTKIEREVRTDRTEEVVVYHKDGSREWYRATVDSVSRGERSVDGFVKSRVVHADGAVVERYVSPDGAEDTFTKMPDGTEVWVSIKEDGKYKEDILLINGRRQVTEISHISDDGNGNTYDYKIIIHYDSNGVELARDFLTIERKIEPPLLDGEPPILSYTVRKSTTYMEDGRPSSWEGTERYHWDPNGTELPVSSRPDLLLDEYLKHIDTLLLISEDFSGHDFPDREAVGVITIESISGTKKLQGYIGTNRADHVEGHSFLYGGDGGDTLVGGSYGDMLFGDTGMTC